MERKSYFEISFFLHVDGFFSFSNSGQYGVCGILCMASRTRSFINFFVCFHFFNLFPLSAGRLGFSRFY